MFQMEIGRFLSDGKTLGFIGTLFCGFFFAVLKSMYWHQYRFMAFAINRQDLECDFRTKNFSTIIYCKRKLVYFAMLVW